jgi:general secretion pathway protein B
LQGLPALLHSAEKNSVSYILEALRKSEQQRLRGAAPGLLAVPMPPGEDAQPAYPIYGLIAAALIGAGVAIGWWRPWADEQAFPAPEALPSTTLESTSRPALPERPPALPDLAKQAAQEAKPVREAAAPAARRVLAPKAATKDANLRARAAAETQKLLSKTLASLPQQKAPLPEATPSPAPQRAAAPVEEKPAGAAPAAAIQQGVVSMAELPPAILQELPAMSIPVHSYSSLPGERIVGINDRLLQEGDYLAPGLRLEQIVPDGLVFSYKNYLFRRGAQ